MAEDAESKPKFILNKQKSQVPLMVESARESETKKKVVVVKKKPASTAPASRTPSQGARPADSSGLKDKKHPIAKKRPAPARNFPGQNAPRTEDGERKKPTFEINAARPNVKAGNLSDKPRNQGRPQGHEGGFTGVQAREGYQSRFSDKNRGRPSTPGNGQAAPYQQGQWQGSPPRQGPPGRGPGPTGFIPRGPGVRPGFPGARPGFAPPASPPPEEGKKGPVKKVFKAKKAVYTRRDREHEFNEDRLFNAKKKQNAKTNAIPTSIEMM
jgi:translation initiation factor IF-2